MPDVVDNNRFAPPRAELVEPGSIAEGPVLAGRGMRLLAVILDGILMSVIQWPLYLMLGGSRLMANMVANPELARDPFAIWGQMLGAMWPGWLLTIAIQVWCLHAYGGTLAKKILGLRIVRTDGSRATAVRLIFGRGTAALVPAMIPLLGMLWFLIDSLMIFRESRRCLHDEIADTIVVTATSSMNASLEASRATNR